MINCIKKILKKLIINPEKYYTCIECRDKNITGCYLSFIENNDIFNIWINQYNIELKISNLIFSEKFRKDIGRHRVIIEYNSDEDKFEILNLICQLKNSCENITNTHFKAFVND